MSVLFAQLRLWWGQQTNLMHAGIIACSILLIGGVVVLGVLVGKHDTATSVSVQRATPHIHIKQHYLQLSGNVTWVHPPQRACMTLAHASTVRRWCWHPRRAQQRVHLWKITPHGQQKMKTTIPLNRSRWQTSFARLSMQTGVHLRVRLSSPRIPAVKQRVRVRTVVPAGCVRQRGAYHLSSHHQRGRKAVALTFDDGPWPTTPNVLRILKQYGVQATFFVIGDQLQSYGNATKEALSAGMAVGNHSYSHPFLGKGGPRATEELTQTNNILRHRFHYQPCVFRAPYGAVSKDLIARAGKLGMNTIGWSVDTRDWSRPGSPSIVSTAVANARDGSIILMHDGGGNRYQTIAALPSIIKSIRKRGYRFVTVPELFGYKTTYRYR